MRDFLGNTVICLIEDTASLIFRELEWAQQLLKTLPFKAKYAYVPSSTFHMTVIPLIDQTHRNTEFWLTVNGTDSDINAIDEAFKRAIDPIPIPSAIRMKIDSCTACRVNLSPYDEETRNGLHRYRKNIAAATGLGLPGHHTYQFHITLAYELVQLTNEERHTLIPVLETINKRLIEGPEYLVPGPPKFVIFNNMHGFHSDLRRRGAN
ncbi:MAG: DUF1868 domain-containing protein [Spirochaetaceae bacterium]|nr:DUF1868 domain-containing protein [Spirochaetaceae bacterium]